MSIFLCLSDTGLFQTISCKKFSESIFNRYFVECHFCIWDSRIIFGKAYIGKIQSLLSCKSVKFICAERSGDLSGSVRTEVKEDHGIFILNGSYRFSIFYDHCRNDKFICLSFFIRSFYSAYRALCLNAFTFCQSFIRQLHTVPAVIPVHSIVTSHYRSNLSYAQFFHLVIQFLDIAFASCSRRISSVQEAVYEYFFQSFSLSQFQQPEEMCDMAVNAAVRKESEKMKGCIIFLCVMNRL